MCRLYFFLYLIVLMWQVGVHMSSPKLSKVCVWVCVCVEQRGAPSECHIEQNY